MSHNFKVGLLWSHIVYGLVNDMTYSFTLWQSNISNDSINQWDTFGVNCYSHLGSQ